MIKIEAVDVNANSTKIVTTVWHVYHSNALIHVLEFAVNQHYAMYRIMCQHVLARRA